MNSAFSWISFTPVAVESEAQGTSIQSLINAQAELETSWESARFASFPQEIILKLESRTQLNHVLISSKSNRPIPELELHIGDGPVDNFLAVQYHRAGIASNILNSYTQIPVTGMGSFLKLIFTTKPTASAYNPQGQVGLAVLKVWGRRMGYEVTTNEIGKVKSKSDDVDRILIGLGMPLQNLILDDLNNLLHAPVDDDTRQTLIEVDKRREKAHEIEDYGALRQIKEDMRILFDIGARILKLKRELDIAISKEDYDLAKRLKDMILELQRKRDSYDAMYETSRYLDMIVMEESEDNHLAIVDRYQEEERLRQELLRRQREEEMHRLRMLQQQTADEEERLRRMQEVKRKQEEPPRRKSPIRPKKTKKEEVQQVKPDDPYEHNEGDNDLEPYLRPKLNEAGGVVRSAEYDILRQADQRKVLRTVGAKLWSALHSENWRHREAAVRALLEFLEAPLLPKYENDTRRLFRSALDLAHISTDDKVLSIYLYALQVILTAMASPICDTKVTPKMINDSMKTFVPILTSKVSELNYRARDISMQVLIEMLRHPHVKIGIMIDHILKLCGPGEDPIEKQPWRIVLSRLEILLHVVQEFGIDNKEWNWKEVYHSIIVPCLHHPNVDVRKNAVELIVSLHSIIGEEIRVEVEAINKRIKPQIYSQILNRISETTEVKDVNSMHVIQESHEWAEQTPPQSVQQRRSMNWNRLKTMIKNAAAEESKKR